MSRLHRFGLIVKNLPWTVGKSELRQHFEEFGKISQVYIPYNISTGLHRGMGFVHFSSHNALISAVEAKHILQGHNLFVSQSRSSETSEAEKEYDNSDSE